jgi:hypothetical protein
MDVPEGFNFIDMEDPRRLPPAEVRLLELRAEPWPDGRRVRAHVQITPFRERPNLDLRIENALGEEVASAALIELITTKLVITLHIRAQQIEKQYTLMGNLYYPELESVDQASFPFEIPTSDEPDEEK